MFNFKGEKVCKLGFVIAEPTLSKGVVRRCAAAESSTELCGCIRCLGYLKTVATGWVGELQNIEYDIGMAWICSLWLFPIDLLNGFNGSRF